MNIHQLIQEIKQSAENVYNSLGTGHTENIYHKALEVDLRIKKINYSTRPHFNNRSITTCTSD